MRRRGARERGVGAIEGDFCRMRGKGKAVLDKKARGARAIIPSALAAVPVCSQPLERLSPIVLIFFLYSYLIFTFSLLFFSFFAQDAQGKRWGFESVSMAVVVAMIVVIARTTTVAGFLLRKRGSVGAAHAPEDEVVPIQDAQTANGERSVHTPNIHQTWEASTCPRW